MPKVSVVIPTYNNARFLAECIESVLVQSFRDFEIIIIDDGSTDDTAELVSTYCPPVRYFRQENQGIISAYNRGIKSSKSEYIAFIDSDDIMLRDALKKGIEVLDKHPEAGFSYGQRYNMDERGNIIGLRKGPWKYSGVREGKEELNQLILHNHVNPQTIVRRRCLDEVGIFNPAFRHGSEDYDLWVRLAKRYAVAYLAESVMKYRVHSGAITSNRKIEEIKRSRVRILESIFKDPDLDPSLSSQRSKAYFHLYFDLAGDAYIRRKMKVARGYLIKAIKTCPSRLISSMLLPLMFLWTRTCIPLPILSLARRNKRYLQIAIWSKLWCLQIKNQGSADA